MTVNPIVNIAKSTLSFIQRHSGYRAFGKSSVIKLPAKIMGKRHISIGTNVFVAERSFISVVDEHNGTRFHPHLKIGDNVRIGTDAHISCVSNVTIEPNVLASARIFISDGIHDYHDIRRPIGDQPMLATGDVLIKEGAFVGINACIMPGVTIGRNAVVGAGAVVTKAVADYTVVAGNPARPIRRYDTSKGDWAKVP